MILRKILVLGMCLILTATGFLISVTIAKSVTSNPLIYLYDINYSSFIYSIGDKIVFWQNDDVLLFDIVQRKYHESFNNSDFAKGLIDLKRLGSQDQEYKPINSRIFLNTSIGLTCYDADNGRSIWVNTQLQNDYYFTYSLPSICINGIIYTIKNYWHKHQIPEIICIDINTGQIRNTIYITGDKLKERNLLYGEIFAIEGNRIIISDKGYYLYCFNTEINKIEWISKAILPLKFSNSKCTVNKEKMILREENQDPNIVIPPCGEYDLYPPFVSIHSLETSVELLSLKAHDFYIKDNYLYCIKFPECYVKKSVISKINLDNMKLENQIEFPYPVKFSYFNFDSMEEFDEKLYIAIEDPDRPIHYISVFDLGKFDFTEKIQKEGELVKSNGLAGRRIHRTESFILINKSSNIEVFSTRNAMNSVYNKYINIIIRILMILLIRKP